MILRDRLKDRSTLMRIGFACLLLGNLLHWFLHPTVTFRQDLVDATFGLLIGISIGCLLASLRRTDRENCRRSANHAHQDDSAQLIGAKVR